jgi:hypothetical protein
MNLCYLGFLIQKDYKYKNQQFNSCTLNSNTKIIHKVTSMINYNNFKIYMSNPRNYSLMKEREQHIQIIKNKKKSENIQKLLPIDSSLFFFSLIFQKISSSP